MYTEVARALASPMLRARFADLGVVPGGEPSDQTRAFVLAEIERWAEVVRATGVSIN
jgi:tripartite-type tricarboxylate transporter receptor subunit TctC